MKHAVRLKPIMINTPVNCAAQLGVLPIASVNVSRTIYLTVDVKGDAVGKIATDTRITRREIDAIGLRDISYADAATTRAAAPNKNDRAND